MFVIGINTGVMHLNNLNIAFKAKQNERDTEPANKNSGNVKAVRVEIDPLYELMVERVNALVSLNMQTPEIENFVIKLNQKIKHWRQHWLCAKAEMTTTRKNLLLLTTNKY